MSCGQNILTGTGLGGGTWPDAANDSLSKIQSDAQNAANNDAMTKAIAAVTALTCTGACNVKTIKQIDFDPCVTTQAWTEVKGKGLSCTVTTSTAWRAEVDCQPFSTVIETGLSKIIQKLPNFT
jgi:hypothetical protein